MRERFPGRLRASTGVSGGWGTPPMVGLRRAPTAPKVRQRPSSGRGKVDVRVFRLVQSLKSLPQASLAPFRREGSVSLLPVLAFGKARTR